MLTIPLIGSDVFFRLLPEDSVPCAHAHALALPHLHPFASNPSPSLSAEKKALLRAKKEAKNPNFSLFQECVFIWEQLRPRDATAEDKAKLVAKITAKGKGKFKELSMNHSSSRVVQACLKFGTPETRKVIWADCKAHLVEMSRSQYGSFVVRKLIDGAQKPEMPGARPRSLLLRAHVADVKPVPAQHRGPGHGPA